MAYLAKALSRPKVAVLFQTHLWGPHIEASAKQIQYSALEHGHDFTVLASSQDPHKIPDSLDSLRLSWTDIKTMYQSGFQSPWASNHWLLMYWWRHHGRMQNYDYVWSIEYDVRAYGNLGHLWASTNTLPHCDYVSTMPIHKSNASTQCWDHTVAPTWSSCPNMTAWKQVFRLSNMFLNYLDVQFEKGLNAQDERALASHAIEGQFTTHDLRQFLASTWSPHPHHAERAKAHWESHFGQSTKNLFLFHPVKT